VTGVRILMVTPLVPFLPSHDGVRVDAAHRLAHLSRRHDVALVAVAAPHDREAERRWARAYADPCLVLPRARWRRPVTLAPANGLRAVLRAVEHVAARFAPDVLHLDGPVLAPLAALAGLPTVLAAHGSRARFARDMRRLTTTPHAWVRAWARERAERRWERRWFRHAAACVVSSDEDRLALADAVPAAQLDVIPPGIALRRYPFRAVTRGHRIVFTGNLAWGPDADAARRLATEILRRVRRGRPAAEVVIAGATPGPAVRALESLPGVRVAATASDLRLILASAAVFVSPVRAGSGPKLAVLEAMALGAPVVATSPALAGLGVQPGHDAIVADSDADLADAVLAVLEQPVLAATLATNARGLVERRYAWPGLTQAWDAVLARVAGQDADAPVRSAA
jgi:glycosyltransferase involved in cell wall biosynthesis